MLDIAIYESGNGGDITLLNGDITTTDGLFNQPYLAHFGGNADGSDWWGNSFFENEPTAKMTSELEKALNDNTRNSVGRNNIEQAANNDLQFLKDTAKVESHVSITGDNLTLIQDQISQQVVSFQWDATKRELIEEIKL